MLIQRENPLDSFGHEEPSYRCITPEKKRKRKRKRKKRYKNLLQKITRNPNPKRNTSLYHQLNKSQKPYITKSKQLIKQERKPGDKRYQKCPKWLVRIDPNHKK